MMIRRNSPWIKHGILNTLEHAMIRVGDALVAIVIIRFLRLEIYSSLATAQAWVAPCMLFFIAPETVLYREYAQWKQEGRESFSSRILSLRRFSWIKGGVSLLLALILASTLPSSFDWWSRFFALTWAFWLPIAAQVSGSDREFLRLSLRLKELNTIGLFQKGATLLGTLGVLIFDLPTPILALAIVNLTSGILTALLSRFLAERALREICFELPPSNLPAPAFSNVILGSFRTFSLWQHVAGVIQNWVQTMDLFFLSAFQVPARTLGLYAVVLKVANLSLAFPTSLSNLFSVWLGRTQNLNEKRKLAQLTGLLILVTATQAAVILLFSPWVLSFLLKRQLSPDEVSSMTSWLMRILGGAAIFSACLLLNSWLSIRMKMSKFVLQVWMPWGICSFLIYAWSARSWGVEGAAWANLPVAGVYIGLVLLFAFEQRHFKIISNTRSH